MKGFIRILEVFISVAIMLTFIYGYFTFETYSDSNWGNVLAKTRSTDLLNSLYKNGFIEKNVINNNYNEIYDVFRNMSSSSYLTSVTIKGIPKNNITIDVIGNNNNKNDLLEILTPLSFTLKNRSITINVINSTNINDTADIIFFFGYENYTLTKQESLVLLKKEKTIFLFSDISQDDDILKNIFDLNNKSGSEINNDNYFYNSDDASFVSHKIEDYFQNTYWRLNTSSGPANFYIRKNQYHLDTGIDGNGDNVVIYNGKNYTENETFVVDTFNLKVYGVDGNSSTSEDGYTEHADIGVVSRNYIFNDLVGNSRVDTDNKTIIKSSDNFSAAKINYQVTKYGKGRTVWISNYDKKYSDFNQLLKSLILWASGEKIQIGNFINNRGTSSSIFIYSNSSIYSVELSVRPVFS